MRDLNIFIGSAVRPLCSYLVPVLALFIFALPSYADVLDVPAQPERVYHTPHKGMTMTAVLATWGEPATKHQTVSEPGTPHQPPINRWDYDSFSVVFERDRVIHTIHPQQPPAVNNSAQ